MPFSPGVLALSKSFPYDLELCMRVNSIKVYTDTCPATVMHDASIIIWNIIICRLDFPEVTPGPG